MKIFILLTIIVAVLFTAWEGFLCALVGYNKECRANFIDTARKEIGTDELVKRMARSIFVSDILYVFLGIMIIIAYAVS